MRTERIGVKSDYLMAEEVRPLNLWLYLCVKDEEHRGRAIIEEEHADMCPRCRCKCAYGIAWMLHKGIAFDAGGDRRRYP